MCVLPDGGQGPSHPWALYAPGPPLVGFIVTPPGQGIELLTWVVLLVIPVTFQWI